MVHFEGLRHLHLKVADIERSARFYESGFGMRRFAVKNDGKLIALASPGLRDQLTLSEGAEGESGAAAGSPGEHGGIDHFGFLLSPGSSLDDSVDQLVRAGATFDRHHDIASGVRTAFLRDPDGYRFQIVKFPRGTKQLIGFLPLLRRLGLWRA